MPVRVGSWYLGFARAVELQGLEGRERDEQLLGLSFEDQTLGWRRVQQHARMLLRLQNALHVERRVAVGHVLEHDHLLVREPG
eukprot:3698569-Rhodomonas_salina.2